MIKQHKKGGEKRAKIKLTNKCNFNYKFFLFDLFFEINLYLKIKHLMILVLLRVFKLL